MPTGTPVCRPVLTIDTAPQVAQALSSQVAKVGKAHRLSLPATMFADPDVGDTQRWQFSLQDGSAFADLADIQRKHVHAARHPFHGTPGDYALRLVSTDKFGAQARLDFTLKLVSASTNAARP